MVRYNLHVYYFSICIIRITMVSRASEGESCSAQLANISFNATSDFDLTTHQRIGIYGGIVAFVVVATVIKAGFSFVTSLNSSRNLHNKMFKAILRAPILFFDTNPVGKQ